MIGRVGINFFTTIFFGWMLVFINPTDLFANSSIREDFSVDWEKRQQVGCGHYGRVYKIPNEFGNLIAAKIHSPFEVEGIPKEIKLLTFIKKKMCESPYFPNYYGCSFGRFWRNDSNQYVLCWRHFMEYMPSSLKNLIDKANKRGILLSESLVKKIIYSVLCAADALHDLHYIHRDLKPDNILLSESADRLLEVEGIEFRTVVTDFGLATEILPSDFIDGRPCTPDMVTMDYRPLENCMSSSLQHYGEYTDTWSIGIMFLTLLVNRNPIWDEILKNYKQYPHYTNRQHLIEGVKVLDSRFKEGGCFFDCGICDQGPSPDKAGIQKVLDHRSFSEMGLTILTRMLVKDTDERSSPKEILNDPYWDDIRDSEASEQSVMDDSWELVIY